MYPTCGGGWEEGTFTVGALHHTLMSMHTIYFRVSFNDTSQSPVNTLKCLLLTLLPCNYLPMSFVVCGRNALMPFIWPLCERSQYRQWCRDTVYNIAGLSSCNEEYTFVPMFVHSSRSSTPVESANTTATSLLLGRYWSMAAYRECCFMWWCGAASWLLTMGLKIYTAWAVRMWHWSVPAYA